MTKFAHIDDDRYFMVMFRTIFEEAFGVFPDYYSEISQFVNMDYDVVFSDLVLQETFGAVSIAELRKKTNALIIAISGMADGLLDSSDLQIIRDAGADEVFSKDVVTAPDFKERVMAVINRNPSCRHVA